MKQAAEFVEENLKTIFAYALSRVLNKADAEDLTNDIVLAILQSGDKISHPDAFYGFVWGIAAKTTRKFMRKKAAFPLMKSMTTPKTGRISRKSSAQRRT